jgi:protein TonB
MSMRELRLIVADERRRVAPALAGAVVAHLAFLLLLTWLAWIRPLPGPTAWRAEAETDRLVWAFEAEASGGSGGGGDQLPDPPRRAPMPAVRPPEPPPPAEPPIEVAEEPLEPLIGASIDVEPVEAPAALVAESDVASPSRGDGSDSGAGEGTESGLGQRSGDRLGSRPDDGAGEDEGDGPGAELDTPPRLLFGPAPQYTAAAMLRRVEGEVQLECLSLATGAVGDCRVVHSIERNAYGLDDEAQQTAQRFRFEPATREGRPVATLVRIVLAFRIR